MSFIEGIIYMIWRGIAIGVIISAPMGPVGILCVQRTLEKGRRAGFFTGVGAALSDLFYCLLTGFGLSFIEVFLEENHDVIQIVGSVVLILFGIYLFRSNPTRALKKPDEQKASRGKTILSGFLFTFSNPLIIFLIIGLFARFNFLLPEISLAHYLIGYVFIFLGALLWWWVITFFVDKVRSHFNLRSMWLVNKITGGIILVFALVGIITAVTGMASARTHSPVYYNSTRGFAPLHPDTSSGAGEPLTITAAGADTIFMFLPSSDAEEFLLTFRLANLHNRSGKRYAYMDETGRKRHVRNPVWGIVLKSGVQSEWISFATIDPRGDDILPASIEINADGIATKSTGVTDGVDIFTGANTWRMALTGGRLQLQGGNRKAETLLEMPLPDFIPDSIGVFVTPGGSVSLDCISYEALSEERPAHGDRFSHFANPDVRFSYFNRSDDEMEGEWEIFDRMLDDDALRMGGSYRLAIVRSGKDYEIVYLDGAVKNAGRWTPGMTKGYLRDTPFSGVFDATWLDPSGREIDGEIKAQYSSGFITLQFPDHAASTLRLKKLKQPHQKTKN